MIFDKKKIEGIFKADIKPKFSIIVSTYGRDRHILPTIHSVILQDLTSFELLIIGDCVGDDTLKCCENLDPRILTFNLPHNYGSQSGPNNFGNNIANGEYIAYLGHDDIWMSNHLSGLLKTFEKLACDVAVSGCAYHGPKGTDFEMITGIFDHNQAAFEHFFPPSSFAHKKHISEAIGGWSPPKELRVGVDVDFLQRVAKNGYQFSSTKVVTVHKFAAGHRYLSYLQPSSEEQSLMLDKIKRKEINTQTCEEMIERAKSKQRFMIDLYEDHSRIEPGFFYYSYRRQKGLEPIQTQTLESVTHIAVDPAPYPLGLDWYSPERNQSDHSYFRWSGPSKRPKILIPFVCSEPVCLTLYLLDPHSVLENMELKLNSEAVTFTKNINQDGWYEVNLQIHLRDIEPSILELMLLKSYCPAQNSRSRDTRELGIFFKGYSIKPT